MVKTALKHYFEEKHTINGIPTIVVNDHHHALFQSLPGYGLSSAL